MFKTTGPRMGGMVVLGTLLWQKCCSTSNNDSTNDITLALPEGGNAGHFLQQLKALRHLTVVLCRAQDPRCKLYHSSS